MKRAPRVHPGAPSQSRSGATTAGTQYCRFGSSWWTSERCIGLSLPNSPKIGRLRRAWGWGAGPPQRPKPLFRQFGLRDVRGRIGVLLADHIEAVGIHDLRPGLDEVADELL